MTKMKKKIKISTGQDQSSTRKEQRQSVNADKGSTTLLSVILLLVAAKKGTVLAVSCDNGVIGDGVCANERC